MILLQLWNYFVTEQLLTFSFDHMATTHWATVCTPKTHV